MHQKEMETKKKQHGESRNTDKTPEEEAHLIQLNISLLERTRLYQEMIVEIGKEKSRYITINNKGE